MSANRVVSAVAAALERNVTCVVLSSWMVEEFEFESKDNMELLSEGRVCYLLGGGEGKLGYSNDSSWLESWSRSFFWVESLVDL